MDAREYFALADQLPTADFREVVGDGGAVIIAPHPDDESLGCGALIAAAVELGKPVRVIVVSDGVGSHPHSRTHPPERLRALRERETTEAVAALGLARENIRFLRLPDRYVPSIGPAAETAAAAIAEEAREISASCLFVTWRHDPHCDHQSSYGIARAAQRMLIGPRLLEYSIWGRALPLGDVSLEPPRGWRLLSRVAQERKRAAILCHRSQWSDVIQDDPEGFRMSEAFIADILARDEVFLETRA